ncbi:MAG TPA: Ig-like domain-containing protein [Pilimelia sp.]|nr:Ig-like domain-containing protein [Pilimelia sp.]
MRPDPDRRGSRRWRSGSRGRRLAAILVAAALALTAGCTDDKPAWQGGGESGPQAKGDQLGAAVTGPAKDATDVPTATEITYTTNKATGATVELKSAAGEVIEGAPRPDGSSWVPTQQLEYGTKYTVTVTAAAEGGKTATASSSFTTMAEPDKLVRVSTFLGDDMVVGVGMPLMVTFGREVPEDLRDDVQRRMFVQTSPSQEGVWRWISGTEVHFRPKVYWKAGTKLSFRVAAGGLPLGDGWYGRADLTIRASVGPAVVMVVNNATKKMTVTKDGKLLRTIPVSLGKKSTPSSYGTMLIIEKYRKTVFDTFAELGPREGYRINIEYAQRLTWSGEFVHSAPWSVASQGRVNVSHGCVNMSPANAQWLFGITRVGDPVTVKGTERKLQNGNGWTDWNLTWDQYVQGSALPYSPPAAPSPSPSPEPTP